MKILCYTDNHFCETSSSLTKYGNKYTVRLENQIASITWVERLADEYGCTGIVCLGDFFDKQSLTDQELTALNDITWNNKLTHFFLVGNHESEEIDLKYNSTSALSSNNRFIISEAHKFVEDDVEFCFLPYVTERNIKSLDDIFGRKSTTKRIIFSHNDIAGIQMGTIISKSGFPINDIESSCDLFLNGHLHNGTKITDKIINLGNLTGKDFGEDATKYKHCAFILDTDTLMIEAIENPFAFNFYQIHIQQLSDLSILDTIKSNAVLKLYCDAALVNSLNDKLMSIMNKIVVSKLVTVQKLANGGETELDISELTVDYLAELCTCCKTKLENTVILDYELAEICK